MEDCDFERRKKFYKNSLKPLSKKRLFKYDFVGFDVETYGDDNHFLMGGLYWYRGKTEKAPVYKAFYDREEMCEYLLTRKFQGKYIVATNLDFDFTKLFYGTKYWNDFKRIQNKSQLITCEYKPKHWQKVGKVKFIDTTNYVFFSVEKLGGIIGVDKLEKPSTWIRVVNEETGEDDYKIIKPRTVAEFRELEEYNKYDCKISCDFMYFLQEGINEAGGVLKNTMASTSFDVWRRGFLKNLLIKEKYILNDESFNDFVFKGYYGGRTEAYESGNYKNLYYYDINSLYPSVMKDFEYPLPNSVRKIHSPDPFFIKRLEGVSDVLVESPSLNKPFLPVRVNKKLCFPVGEFRGVYNHCELRKALELGYVIKKVYKQYVYDKTFLPFSDFVDFFYNKRLAYKKDGSPMQLPMKLILNTLYGKFGQRRVNDSTILDLRLIDNLKDLEKAMSFGDVKGDYVLINQERVFNGKNAYPIIASYVTSYARIRMYDYIKDDSVIYTDTDSIITKKDLGIDSKLLGEMKLEGFYKEGSVVKPKMYRLKSDDEEIIKCKGVRRVNNDDFERMLSGGVVKKLKLAKIRESIRRGLVPYSKQVVPKFMKLEDNKRNWKEGVSSPLVVSYYSDLDTNLTSDGYELLYEKAMRKKEKEAREDFEAFVSSDLFDSASVGDDISVREFVNDEIRGVLE